MAKFEHPSVHLNKTWPLVYTAMSKHLFYARMFVSKFVIDNGGVPLNPFMIYDYFMLDTVAKDAVREGNNSIVRRADEIWVFGPISDGVLAEIKLAKELTKPIRYFAVQKPHTFIEVAPTEALLEEEVAQFRHELVDEN
jgi:hypothetical protein